MTGYLHKYYYHQGDIMYTVYKYTNTINGKMYVGQTKDQRNRKNNHKWKSNPCTAMAHAIEKYGWDAFVYEVLVDGLTVEEANRLEVQYIKELNTMAPNGYNLAPGGDNMSGEWSAERNQRISEAQQARWDAMDPEKREAISKRVQQQYRTKPAHEKAAQVERCKANAAGYADPEEKARRVAKWRASKYGTRND
jgi:group I intron endonuclease